MAPIVIYPTTLTRLSCRLQYHWSRTYRSIRSAPAFEFGKAIHHALERYYGHEEDPIMAFTKYMRQNSVSLAGFGIASDPDLVLGTSMLRNYMDAYRAERFRVWYTEKEIARRIPVPEDEPNPPARAKKFYIGARIDAIVYDQTVGLPFVLEHKTFENFYPATLPLDHQFVIEKFVGEGITSGPLAGVIYNGLRKKASLGKSKVNLFERHRIMVNEHQVKEVLRRAYWSLIMVTDPDFKVYPEPSGIKCSMCDFKQPCTEYQRGGDYKFLLENTFELRENDEEDDWE